MSKKDEFIKYVEKAIEAYSQEMNDDARTYWETFKSKEEKIKPMFTDNGKLILNYMRESMPEGRAKDIGEGLFISSRTVSGAIRKLVTDGFVEKIEGSDPVTYVITEKGKTVVIE